jgi:hypothetical protein
MARKSTSSGNSIISVIFGILLLMIFSYGLRSVLCSNTSRDNWSCILVCLSFTFMLVIIISIIYSLIYL